MAGPLRGPRRFDEDPSCTSSHRLGRICCRDHLLSGAETAGVVQPGEHPRVRRTEDGQGQPGQVRYAVGASRVQGGTVRQNPVFASSTTVSAWGSPPTFSIRCST